MASAPRDAVVARLRAAGCVFAEDEARLLASQAADQADLDALAARRAAGEPLEHVLGWAEFCGRRIDVDPGVFVPRRRTEFLAAKAAELGAAAGDPRRRSIVVDLCCGSGAVGAVLADELGAEVHAADVDPAAAACARRNLSKRGGRVYLGDLYDPLPPGLRGRVGILTVNAPYVPSADVRLMPPEARVHEPLRALDGGEDGLDVVRRAAAGATPWLAPGGSLLIETSARQAARAAQAVDAAGLVSGVASSEEFGATVVIGSTPGRRRRSRRWRPPRTGRGSAADARRSP